MVIAGCLNQARSIFEKFDEILYGPAPEELVVETHEAIRKLLLSQESQEFTSLPSQGDKEAIASGDEFVRRIIEAVAPIIPITLRDKSLDGAYFRSALRLVAVAEFVFAQYEADVRIKANPAGVVGMCNTMHGEIKRAAMYNDELKSVDDFIKEMKGQYQTSLGLGSSFARDSAIQGGGRGKRRRGRASYRSNRYLGHSLPRGRGMARHQEPVGYARGRASRFNYPVTHNFYEGTLPMGGNTPGVCFGYQAGTCRRGRSCRFAHES